MNTPSPHPSSVITPSITSDSYHRLKERPRKIISLIQDHIQEHGYSPSFRFLAERLNVKSLSSISYQVKKLVEQGWLIKEEYNARTLTLSPAAHAVLEGNLRDTKHEITRGIELETQDTPPTSEDVLRIPLIPASSLARMSIPLSFEKNQYPELSIPLSFLPHPQNDQQKRLSFITYCTDNQMTGYALREGDIVIISTHRQAQDGDIVVASVNGHILIRLLSIDSTGRYLLSSPVDEEYYSLSSRDIFHAEPGQGKYINFQEQKINILGIVESSLRSLRADQ